MEALATALALQGLVLGSFARWELKCKCQAEKQLCGISWLRTSCTSIFGLVARGSSHRKAGTRSPCGTSCFFHLCHVSRPSPVLFPLLASKSTSSGVLLVTGASPMLSHGCGIAMVQHGSGGLGLFNFHSLPEFMDFSHFLKTNKFRLFEDHPLRK